MSLPVLFLMLFSEPARAGVETAVGLSGVTGSIGQAGAVSVRRRWDSGVQLGMRVEGYRARGWYLDGWPVRDGRAYAGIVSGSIPLVQQDGVRIDLEIDAGLRQLDATDTDASTQQATVLIADVSPMVTLPLGDAFGLRLGFRRITHQQRSPSVVAEATGSLLRAGVLWIPNDDFQVGVEGIAGDAFGFNGDGGKAIAQVGGVVRWVPGASHTYTNH